MRSSTTGSNPSRRSSHSPASNASGERACGRDHRHAVAGAQPARLIRASQVGTQETDPGQHSFSLLNSQFSILEASSSPPPPPGVRRSPRSAQPPGMQRPPGGASGGRVAVPGTVQRRLHGREARLGPPVPRHRVLDAFDGTSSRSTACTRASSAAAWPAKSVLHRSAHRSRRRGPRRKPARASGRPDDGFHVEVVGEHHALEPELAAQQAGRRSRARASQAADRRARARAGGR